MLSGEPVMPRELSFSFCKGPLETACVGDRPRAIPISIWDDRIVGQRPELTQEPNRVNKADHLASQLPALLAESEPDG